MSDAPRLVFAGTPDFAAPTLEALHQAGFPPVAVYTQPDRPAGRGRRPRASPVKQTAQRLGLPILQPESLRNDSARRELAALRPDLMVVIAYGLILPADILAMPRLGCVNLHASLLPRWRGAAPIQRAILAGDRETGICLMQMEAGLDTGPVLARAATPIHAADTGGSLHDRLAGIAASLMARELPAILAGRLSATAQEDAAASYARKLSKDEARLDWRLSAAQLQRQVAAFNPWPVAETSWQASTLRVWRAQVAGPAADAADPTHGGQGGQDERPPGQAEPGTVLAAGPRGLDVATGDGILRLLDIQPAGGRAMAVGAFLSGRKLSVGEQLG